MKKLLALMTALVMVLSLGSALAAEKKLNIVCDTFPCYDWVREILGDRINEVNLSLLQDSGVDLHNFQPSVQDIAKVSEADLFAYVGGPSDEWAADAVAAAKNKNMAVVNLVKTLGDQVKLEEEVEGMQQSEHHHHHHDENAGGEHGADCEGGKCDAVSCDKDHDHDKNCEDACGHDHDHEKETTCICGAKHDHKHDKDADHDHDHEHSKDADHDHDHQHDKGADHGHNHEHHCHNHADEHVWLSLRHAKTLTLHIAQKLAELDAAHADTYIANAKAYAEKLEKLDKQYQEAADNAKNKTLLFADRFPFRYMTDDYGIRYYVAFTGCSAESEASFETVAFLAGKLDELDLPAVMVIDGSNRKIAGAVLGASKNRNRPVLTLDSMQTVDRRAIDKGLTYLGVMQSNLNVLKDALK